MKIICFITLLFLTSSVFCQTGGDVQKIHYTSDQTKSLGLPFSDAVIVGNMIYLSGQIGSKPGVMRVVKGGIRAETIQAMNNIKETLEANGATMDDVVKCLVMLADVKEWGIFNEEYVKFFGENKPARSAFGANGLALGARVEIECMACRK